MSEPASTSTQGPPEPTNRGRGTKRGSEDAGDAAPSEKRPRLPDIYLTTDYVPDHPDPEYVTTEFMRRNRPPPMYLIQRGRSPRRIYSNSILGFLSDELNDPLRFVKNGRVLPDCLHPEDSPDARTSAKRSAVKQDEPVAREEAPDAQDNEDVDLDLDVTMTDVEWSFDDSDVPPPAVSGTSSSQLAPAPAAMSAAPQDASPSNVVAAPEPVAVVSPSPIIAVDETVPQSRLKKGESDKLPRIPSMRTWRKPGPSPLRKSITPKEPILVRNCKTRFETIRIWTRYLDIGERADGTFVDLASVHPAFRSRLPENIPHRRRPPPKYLQVKKAPRDLRVVPALAPQLLKRRAFESTCDPKDSNILLKLWRAHAPEFSLLLRLHTEEYMRGMKMRLGEKVPMRAYDCDNPRPAPCKGTPSGKEVPAPLRPRLVRPPRRYKLKSRR